MTEYSALQRLGEWKRRLPTIWQEVETERRQWRPGLPSWPKHVFLPRDRAAKATVRAWETEGIKPRHDDEHEMIFKTTQALAAWRMTKGIYRIDPTLYHDLLNTPVTGAIPGEILRHMPEWCVYIETPGVNATAPDGETMAVDGLWFWLDEEPFEAHFLMDVPRYYLPVVYASYEVFESLPDSIERAEAGKKSKPQWYRSLFSLLLFLCSQSAEISREGGLANSEPRKVRRRNVKLFAANGPKVWNVGTRLGAALRAAYARAEASAEPHAGNSPRPHIRRAHWHTYRTGKGRSQIELKWLPPIPVGIEDYDAMPAVIHDVA